MSEIIFEQKKHIGILTLNRPEALNALNHDMIKALYTILKQWAQDESIHAVIIQSKDARAFCAGGDVRALYHLRHDKEAQRSFFEDEYALNRLIGEYPKPYISLLNGITMGGGVGISMLGSHPLGTHKLRFAMPETTIGLFPDVGASYLLNRAPGATGMYIGLTGVTLDAESCLYAGLIRHIVNEQDFNLIIQDLIDADLSHNPHLQVELILERYKERSGRSWLLEQQSFIDQNFIQTSVRAIISTLNQDPKAQETLSLLSTKSPLSLCVTFAQLQKSKGLDIGGCLDIDAVLVEHFIQGHDFYEGVRALLIDKDKNPHWQPKTLDEVTMSMINEYFIETRAYV